MKKAIAGFYLLVSFLLLSPVLSAQEMGEDPDMTVNAQTKAEVIKVLAQHLREEYVIPDIGDKVANVLEQHQAHGDYNSVTSAKEFAQLLTKQIDEVAHDGHMAIQFHANERPPQQARMRMLTSTNYCYDEAKRLEGNIGYLKFDCFQAPDQAGTILAAAMAFLANTDAMILDLRDNHGGSSWMVDTVASYFFSGDKSILLNTTEVRKPGTNEYSDPKQFWTLPHLLGQRYLNKEVYILTSHHTFSGGEEFSYDMQTQKRATIVGETTGGGANMPVPVRLADHFIASIPHGHSINPITHTNWERVGVKPDIGMPPQDALDAAHKTALEHLIAKTTDEQELGALKHALANVGASPAVRKQQK